MVMFLPNGFAIAGVVDAMTSNVELLLDVDGAP
jgi:hypothetical protein